MGVYSHMNQLYRENMRKIRTSRYNKKRGLKKPVPSDYVTASGKVEIPEISFQEKMVLKRRVEKRQAHQKKMTIIGITVAMIAVVPIAFFLINEITAGQNAPNNVKPSAELLMEQDYQTFIGYGDEFLNKGQWYNAAFEYRRAVNLGIDDKRADFRLTFALIRLCENEEEGCSEAQSRLNQLTSRFPLDPNVEELRLRWEGISK